MYVLAPSCQGKPVAGTWMVPPSSFSSSTESKTGTASSPSLGTVRYSVLSAGPPGSRPKLKGLTAGSAPAEPPLIAACCGAASEGSKKFWYFGASARSSSESTSSGVSVSIFVPPRAALRFRRLGLVSVDCGGLRVRGVSRGRQGGSVEEDLVEIASTERGPAGSGLAESDPAPVGLARLFFKICWRRGCDDEERQRKGQEQGYECPARVKRVAFAQGQSVRRTARCLCSPGRRPWPASRPCPRTALRPRGPRPWSGRPEGRCWPAARRRSAS